MQNEERKCWMCGTVKSLTSANFCRDSHNPKGFQAACKACSRTRSRKYNAEHREYFKQKGREKYDPSQNAGRYLKYRDDYLRRREESSKSVRGRLRDLLVSARTRAKKSNLPCTITLNWVMALYEEQKGCCILTGLPFSLERNPLGKRVHMPFSPSLDQIKAGAGYTLENTRLVCVIVNLALNRFGEDTFRTMCKSYLRRQSELESSLIKTG